MFALVLSCAKPTLTKKCATFSVPSVHIDSQLVTRARLGLDGPKTLARAALERGVTEGRRGLGVIYVWASGNGGLKGDNCNCDGEALPFFKQITHVLHVLHCRSKGYVSSIYTLAIGSASKSGQFPWYCERCASIHAVAYSSGSHNDPKAITHTC